MKRRQSLVLVLTVLAALAGGGLARAQEVLVGEIPFTFIAGGVAHDPGRYELRVTDDQSLLTLVPEGKGPATAVLAVTRLASLANGITDSRLVFDKVGNTYYLAEAWFSEQDGYVLHTTREPHTHETVRLNSKAD